MKWGFFKTITTLASAKGRLPGEWSQIWLLSFLSEPQINTRFSRLHRNLKPGLSRVLMMKKVVGFENFFIFTLVKVLVLRPKIGFEKKRQG